MITLRTNHRSGFILRSGQGSSCVRVGVHPAFGIVRARRWCDYAVGVVSKAFTHTLAPGVSCVDCVGVEHAPPGCEESVEALQS